jgi:hypothetical protein
MKALGMMMMLMILMMMIIMEEQLRSCNSVCQWRGGGYTHEDADFIWRQIIDFT